MRVFLLGEQTRELGADLFSWFTPLSCEKLPSREGARRLSLTCPLLGFEGGVLPEVECVMAMLLWRLRGATMNDRSHQPLGGLGGTPSPLRELQYQRPRIAQASTRTPVLGVESLRVSLSYLLTLPAKPILRDQR
jgi:hypothetical protein